MNNVPLSDEKIIDNFFKAIGYFDAHEHIYAGKNNGFSQSGKTLHYDLEVTGGSFIYRRQCASVFGFHEELIKEVQQLFLRHILC